MKKYVVFCLAVIALLMGSCKNEDISISREVTFDVNPYEVISGFVPNEYLTGDLESLPTGWKLRVHVLVYDQKGDLVDSEIRYLDDYNSTMNASFELADGQYIVVATSDAVKYNGGVTFEYWEFSGKDRLSDFQITDGTYYNTDGRKILGAGNKKFILGAGQTTFHIDMEPQGALVFELVRGLHEYDEITAFELLMNKRPNSVSFSNDGSTNIYVTDLTSMYWHLCEFDPENFSSLHGYGYEFLLPTGRTNFVWNTQWADGSSMELTDVMTLEVGSGKMYQFVLDMENLTSYYGEMGDKSIPSFRSESMSRMSSDPEAVVKNIEK